LTLQKIKVTIITKQEGANKWPRTMRINATGL